MDKMVTQADGDVIITNDGATILGKMTVTQPAAKMLVELAKSQDVAAGDGTTTVTILCGSLLKKCLVLLDKGIHSNVISDAFYKASHTAATFLEKTVGVPVNLDDRDSLLKAANTSLSSKVISQYTSMLSPIAVDSILKVMEPTRMVDLDNIRIVKKLGATVDDSEMVDGLVLKHKASPRGNVSPYRKEKANICLAQFQISSPKPDIESSVVVSDYIQMDRVLREERHYIIQIVTKLKVLECNVILLQKSILRDAVSELGEHYLAKASILLIKDIERENVEFISKTIGCRPVAHLDHLTKNELARAAMVEEVQVGPDKVIKITGIDKKGPTVTLLLRGSNKLVLDEADRSLHDALCVVRCLIKKPYLVPGGGACEIEIAKNLTELSTTLEGIESYCAQAFADALEIVPYTLAENGGLEPVNIVTELRTRHRRGHMHDGINIRKGTISNMYEENVVQPLMVTTSALDLASECTRMILKIDNIIQTR
jgi:T-complex protein 1 subunit delta